MTQQSSQLDLDLLQYTHSALTSVGKRQDDSTVSCEELYRSTGVVVER